MKHKVVSDTAQPVGLRLKLARVRTGMKQYELAARVGIPNTVLSLIESGRRTPDDMLLGRLWAELGGETAERVA